MAEVKKAYKSETSRLYTDYVKNIVPALEKELGIKNANEVPKLERIVLNMGLGDVKDNAKSLNLAIDELSLIAGQKAVPTFAKKSISNFKVREGQKLGAKVTLRGQRMYHFLDELISIALPRVRDFKGVKKGFDGRGNFAMGIKEQLIFPEINFDKVEKIRGLDIIIVTSAKTDKECELLLSKLGMPFKA